MQSKIACLKLCKKTASEHIFPINDLGGAGIYFFSVAGRNPRNP